MLSLCLLNFPTKTLPYGDFSVRGVFLQPLFCEALEVIMKKMLVVAGVLAVITGVVAAVCKNRNPV